MSNPFGALAGVTSVGGNRRASTLKSWLSSSLPTSPTSTASMSSLTNAQSSRRPWDRLDKSKSKVRVAVQIHPATQGTKLCWLWNAQHNRQMCDVFVFSLIRSDSDWLCCVGRWTVVIKASTWFSSCYLFVINPSSRITLVRKRLPNRRYILPFCLALEITYLCSEVSFKSSNTCLF